MFFTKFSVTRRLATGAILVAMLVLGIYGFFRLPMDFLPDITYPQIKIHIWWRGATAEEIEKNIAEAVELQIATVDGLDYLESSSIEGMYALMVWFKYGVDVDVAYQDVLAAMARVSRNLPVGIDPPVIVKADPSQLPIVQLALSSDRIDLVKLRTWTENWFQQALLTVPGVAGSEIAGGLKREIRVHLKPSILEKHHLTISGIIKRLKDENIEQFGGRVTTGPQEIIARTMGEYADIDEIRNIIISAEGNAKLRLKDIAVVEDLHEDIRLYARLNGKPCIKLSVLKQADANTVEVEKALAKRLKELKPVLPEGVKIEMVENQADYIKTALSGVRNTAILASILVIVVVFLLLGSFRQVFVLMLAMPITLVLNLGLMKIAGFSINIFSLGGLVVSIGVVLNNSIVIIENITRRRGIQPNDDLRDLASESTAEVTSAVMAATVSFLALFVPFLLVPGLVSLLFQELILVVAGVVVISLIVALTITPMLSTLIFRKTKREKKTLFERMFSRVQDGYGRLLYGIIRWRKVVLLGALGATAFFVVLIVNLGTEFLPQMDDGRIVIKVKMPTGTSNKVTNMVVLDIERQLSGEPDIESIFSLAGGREWSLYTYEIANEGQINIQLVPPAKRDMSTKDYINKLRSKINKILIPGAKIMVIPMKVKGIKKMGESDIEVKIKGQDLATLFKLAQQVMEHMKEQSSLTNIHLNLDMTKPEYQVEVDREKASELGVSVADISNTLRSLISGVIATRYQEDNEYYNIRVMIPEKDIMSQQDVENLIVTGDKGQLIRIRDVAKVKLALGPVEILREDQTKMIIARADVRGTNVGSASNELRKRLTNISWPPGYEYSFGGQVQMISEMKDVIFSILIFAVFFSFIALIVQFNSLSIPLIILGAMPICLSGIGITMMIMGLPLGGTVAIGLLVIIASLINDGVLILTFAKELEQKMSRIDAIVEAGKLRLRALIMTTVCVLIGFVPLALNLEAGGEMLQPMAAAAIGGLLVEIPVALFLIPCLYVMIGKSKGDKSTKEQLKTA